MKKLLLTFAISLLATTTFAATLQISVSDPINNKILEEVEVKLDTEIAEYFSKNEIYEFTDFDFYEGDALDFTKDGYLPISGAISCNVCSENSCPLDCNQFVYTYENGIDFEEVIFDVDLDNPDATYELNVKMYPERKKIISGKIYEKRDGIPKEIKD